MTYDPVYCVTSTIVWFFWDETGTHQYGPYISEEGARLKLNEYQNSLNNENLTFEQILPLLKVGRKVRRKMRLVDAYLCVENENFYTITTHNVNINTYYFHYADMVATDWEILE